MTSSNDAVSALRKAVEVSPDNVPLRVHLADMLCGLSRYDEAQKEYTTALTLSPDDNAVKVGLAQTFYQLGKFMQALVIVESLLGAQNPPAKAYILHARLLLNDGNAEKALAQYKNGISIDSSVADESLADRLGTTKNATRPTNANSAKDDVIDGKLRAAATHSGYEPDDEDDDGIFDDIERSRIKFANVGGMEPVKEQVRMKIIYPIKNPDVYKAYGMKTGGGILMYGPPGCGKTYLARATAGEIDAGFLSVGINDVLEMWIGSSERNLHEIFERARRNRPCVLFFDEVDALAASRSQTSNSSGRHVINQFLAELDGINSDNEGILFLAATNAPWHLDSAFRRPGRFDRILFVPPPDRQARAEILRILLTGKPTESVDFEHLGKRTDNFSGADLQALVEQTLAKKIEQAMKEGVPKPITTKDLEASIKQVKPSTSEWFATARNYALYSNEGGQYDEIRTYLKL